MDAALHLKRFVKVLWRKVFNQDLNSASKKAGNHILIFLIDLTFCHYIFSAFVHPLVCSLFHFPCLPFENSPAFTNNTEFCWKYLNFSVLDHTEKLLLHKDQLRGSHFSWATGHVTNSTLRKVLVVLGLSWCCCVVLLDKVSSQGTRACDVFVPVCCGRKWRGLFKVPREHSLGQMPLVGLTCSGSGDSCLPS